MQELGDGLTGFPGAGRQNPECDVISIEHALSLVEPWLAAYGAFALFVAIYFESFGAPLPGESALVAASVLAVRGDLSIIAVVVCPVISARTLRWTFIRTPVTAKAWRIR